AFVAALLSPWLSALWGLASLSAFLSPCEAAGTLRPPSSARAGVALSPPTAHRATTAAVATATRLAAERVPDCRLAFASSAPTGAPKVMPFVLVYRRLVRMRVLPSKGRERPQTPRL